MVNCNWKEKAIEKIYPLRLKVYTFQKFQKPSKPYKVAKFIRWILECEDNKFKEASLQELCCSLS